ncbi:uncharacterized protein LOC120203996 [Hibiscus syriacus]|uniref:uncharacterized protein LOC120203996 n=1 Tax=Hibiscus syriacus TaxID=106335 RepID=UPI0019224243|nr:uncharacterized protein LOC120203996 [Hibiscus syriacus]
MQQIKDSWKDFGDESNEETLSLCDLVMENDRSNEFWDDDDDFSKRDENGDLFEFSSDHLPASASIFPENNIIFCGKIISSRESQPINVGNKSQMPKFRIERGNHEKSKNFSCGNRCLFPWKTSSSSSPSLFNKSRTFPSSKSTKESERRSFNKSFSVPASVSKNKYGKFSDEKFYFPVKQVSTPVKPRWYLFAFGVGRFPMEIELKDMKMRQSRKYTTMKFRSPGGDRSENVKSDQRRRSGKGFRILLKVLGWNQIFI